MLICQPGFARHSTFHGTPAPTPYPPPDPMPAGWKMDRIRDGSFRQDLYYRVTRFTVEVPPLRERREDIPLLAQHFLKLFAEEMGLPVPALESAALGVLQKGEFAGSVRELKNVVERTLSQVTRPANLTNK